MNLYQLKKFFRPGKCIMSNRYSENKRLKLIHTSIIDSEWFHITFNDGLWISGNVGALERLVESEIKRENESISVP